MGWSKRIRLEGEHYKPFKVSRTALIDALKRHPSFAEAAKHLGVSRTTLYKSMRRYGVRKPSVQRGRSDLRRFTDQELASAILKCRTIRELSDHLHGAHVQTIRVHADRLGLMLPVAVVPATTELQIAKKFWGEATIEDISAALNFSRGRTYRFLMRCSKHLATTHCPVLAIPKTVGEVKVMMTYLQTDETDIVKLYDLTLVPIATIESYMRRCNL